MDVLLPVGFNRRGWRHVHACLLSILCAIKHVVLCIFPFYLINHNKLDGHTSHMFDTYFSSIT
jgi:hypothetical protein